MRSLAVAAAVVCLWGPVAHPAAAAVPPEQGGPAVGLQCVERADFPPLPNVIDARWSPDGTTLAVTWFARLPSDFTPTGYVETEITDLLDVRRGTLRPLGVGDRVQWSGTGAYLSYWGPRADELRVVRPDGQVLARLTPTIPELRWAGDELLFVEEDQIRSWARDQVRTVARFADDMVPRYPRDDLYWNADGTRFSITRYAADGAVERWVGLTRSAETAPLPSEGAALIEWTPDPGTLLLRYGDRLELREIATGASGGVPLEHGGVHGWTARGSLVLGRISPTVPAGTAFDSFGVAWPAAPRSATLPNVLGPRTFSADGRYFAGTTRTSAHDTVLAVYRCGDISRVPTTAARDALAIAKERLVRPVAGDIGQFMQGRHSGVDLAAPFGSPIFAADDGTVTTVGWIPNGGVRVCLDHAGGLETCYFHVSAALVSPGERVVRGQSIALVGLTGLATGPHLHWEARLFGRLVDPLSR